MSRVTPSQLEQQASDFNLSEGVDSSEDVYTFVDHSDRHPFCSPPSFGASNTTNPTAHTQISAASHSAHRTDSERWKGFETLSRMNGLLALAQSQKTSPAPSMTGSQINASSMPTEDQMNQHHKNVKRRFAERSSVDDFEEFRQAMRMFALQKCSVSVQTAFCEDTRIFFEVMGPEHDRACYHLIMESYDMTDSNKTQVTALLRFVVSKINRARLMSEAVWLSGRLCNEFIHNESDDYELLSVLEYLSKAYCSDGGKACDSRYFKGKGKIIRSNYRKSKHAFKKNATKACKPN